MQSPGERMRHAEPCGHHTAPAPRAVETGESVSPDDLEISAELVAPTANVLASVFRVFEDQRKELSVRLLGEVGAFTGFSHLETSPPTPPLQGEDETNLVVSTTIHRRTTTTTTFELLVWGADGQRSPWLVRGSGVGVYPALRRRAADGGQRMLSTAGAVR